MKCPNCGHVDSLSVDCTPEYNNEKPYELVCWFCGWFSDRFDYNGGEAYVNETDFVNIEQVIEK